MGRCLGQILARLAVVVLVTPFFVLIVACAFAIATSQAQHYLGSAISVIVGFVAGSSAGIALLYGLSRWLISVEKTWPHEDDERLGM